MSDVLIVGGGVVGLSLALELAREKLRVQVIDRSLLAREASWAGAGILPPADGETALHPYDQLRALSYELHAQWSEQLLAETGIDNGYRRCGGLYLARTAGEAAALRGMRNVFLEERVAVEQVAIEDVGALEPALAEAAASGRFKAAYNVPEECQIRNPRHLRALLMACQQQGVELLPNVEATEFVVQGERLEGVRTSAGVLRAGQYCLTSGSWTQQLLAQLGIANGILPIRGQMLLYKCAHQLFMRVLNEGNRYLVAREDGHVLVGSTEEEVGFDKRTTDVAIADLKAFAVALVPALAAAEFQQAWAGLRPATFDGLPYLGPIPTLTNAFVAAGHFRSGLYLSPGTAVVMSELLRGLTPQIQLEAFRVGRG
jgi:glycine oxidase